MLLVVGLLLSQPLVLLLLTLLWLVMLVLLLQHLELLLQVLKQLLLLLLLPRLQQLWSQLQGQLCKRRLLQRQFLARVEGEVKERGSTPRTSRAFKKHRALQPWSKQPRMARLCEECAALAWHMLQVA